MQAPKTNGSNEQLVFGGSKYISLGDKEPIEILVLDDYNQPLTGRTDVHIRIRRHQDDLYYDWADDTFKVAGDVSQPTQALQEVSALYSPGIYRLNTIKHARGWNTSLIDNPGTNDVYDITVLQAGGTDISGLPVGYELHVGTLSILPSEIADAVWDAQQSAHTVAGSFGDLVRRIVGLQKENYYIDQMIYNVRGLMTSGRIRLFHTKADALAATEGGTGEGEFATYSFDSTETPGATERAKTARSVRDS